MAASQIVAVANQKGGVGKSTTVIALAAAWAAVGKKVLIVDCDFQGNVTDWLGLQEEAIAEKRTLTHAIRSKKTIAKLRVPTDMKNVDLIAADISLNSEMRRLNGSSRQFQILKRLLNCEEKEEYDYILIDTHPSIDPLFESVMGYADAYLVPVFAEKHPYSGLEYLTQAVEQIREDVNPDLNFLGLAVTRFNKDNATHRRFEAKMRDLAKTSGIPVFKTVIPSSEAVAGASAAQQSLLDYCPKLPVSLAYKALAKEIHLKLVRKKTRGQPSSKRTGRSGAKEFGGLGFD